MGIEGRPVKMFSMILPVWGKSYADTFINYSLPSLKAQTKPIGSPDIELIISTDHETAAYIKEQYMGELSALNTAFLTTDVFYDISPHKMQTHLYKLGLVHASQSHGTDAFAVFITPDIILPNNAMEAIAHKVQSGVLCCYMLGLRLLDSTESRSHLDSLVQDGVLTLSSWQLIELAYTFVHPQTAWLTTNNYWISRPRDFYPHIYLKTEHEFHARGFHLHPLYLKVPRRLPVIRDTIDGDFVGRLKLARHQIGFFDDNDPVVSVDLAPKNRFGDQALYNEPIHPHSVFQFGIRQTAFQKELFCHLFRLSANRQFESSSAIVPYQIDTRSELERYSVSLSGLSPYLARIHLIIGYLSLPIFRRLLPSRIRRIILEALKSMWLGADRPHYSVTYVHREEI